MIVRFSHANGHKEKRREETCDICIWLLAFEILKRHHLKRPEKENSPFAKFIDYNDASENLKHPCMKTFCGLEYSKKFHDKQYSKVEIHKILNALGFVFSFSVFVRWIFKDKRIVKQHHTYFEWWIGEKSTVFEEGGRDEENKWLTYL